MNREKMALGWALQFLASGDYEITEYTWVSEALRDFIDVRVKAQHNGTTMFGWGASQISDLALIKAVAEVLERLVMIETNAPSSNGFAAHLSFGEAAENAINELRERDVFMTHYLTSTPFIKERFELTGDEKLSVENWIYERQLTLEYYQLGHCGSLCVVGGEQASIPFGFSLGMSFSADKVSCQRKAFIEAARRTADPHAGITSVSLKEFMNFESPTFNDHGKLGFDLEHAKWFRSIFLNGNGKYIAEIPVGDIKCEEIHWPFSTDCPFKFAYASSSRAQSIFPGFTVDNLVNLERLSEAVGRKLSKSDVNTIPHPFA